ncbi:hypothetical protein SDC9_156582 [bioreactor metagenome]|uniref:Uncharacterized protein n=1 Tax=bioreactor metagenome TaxID=1076179 RepID=A0A645FA03_9ZZZZ
MTHLSGRTGSAQRHLPLSRRKRSGEAPFLLKPLECWRLVCHGFNNAILVEAEENSAPILAVEAFVDVRIVFGTVGEFFGADSAVKQIRDSNK